LLAVEKSLHLRHSGDRSTVCAVRVIECAELLAADLLRNADRAAGASPSATSSGI